jgi:probable F420-dependent oxidoreductase
MEWGVHLPHLGRQATRDNVVRFAQRVEALGFDSAWVSDHIAWPSAIQSKYPYSEDGSFAPAPDLPWLDTIGTLFFVAGCTERLRLGTSVLILGHRPPVLTAKAVASLDVLSGGRAILGVGVGWMREEFEVLGMPFDRRGARADEQLALLRVLFRDARPRFDGPFTTLPEVGFEPKPIQARLPIWVGGDSEAAYRRTARTGDGFHAAFQDRAVVERAWARVRTLAEEAGRDPGDLVLSVRLFLDPHGAMPASRSIAGSSEHMRDTVGGWAEAGVHHLVLDPVARGGVDGRLDALEQFMAEVA